MIFTNPSGKKGVVTSKSGSATTSSDNLQQLQGGIVSILISSISSNTSPHFSQYSCNPSLFDSEDNLSLISIKDINKQRSNEILKNLNIN